jgi:uncharacterized protein YjiS (DUF1127 family)
VFTAAEEKLIETRSSTWLRTAARALSLWYHRYRTRNELGHMLQLGFIGERELRDMGVTRGEVAFEAEKPFWRV